MATVRANFKCKRSIENNWRITASDDGRNGRELFRMAFIKRTGYGGEKVRGLPIKHGAQSVQFSRILTIARISGSGQSPTLSGETGYHYFARSLVTFRAP